MSLIVRLQLKNNVNQNVYKNIRFYSNSQLKIKMHQYKKIFKNFAKTIKRLRCVFVLIKRFFFHVFFFIFFNIFVKNNVIQKYL